MLHHIKYSCAKLLQIFSNIYFETKCPKKLDQKNFLGHFVSKYILENIYFETKWIFSNIYVRNRFK